MKTIIYTASAAKQLDALAADSREQIARELDTYAIDGIGDVKQFSGRQGYRLRVGRYRVLFDQDSMTILAIYIGKRETTTYRRN